MKINITNIPRSIDDYINICSEQGHNIHNLQSIESASCKEILALDVVDYISAKHIFKVLENWVSKLRHGGKITIGGTDYIELMRAIEMGEINTAEINIIMYGNQESTWQFKIGMYTLPDIVDSLRQLGLKIIKQRLSQFRFEIEAERP